MNNKQQGRILDEIYESAVDLHKEGVITEKRIGEYQILCSSNKTVNFVTKIKNKKLKKTPSKMTSSPKSL